VESASFLQATPARSLPQSARQLSTTYTFGASVCQRARGLTPCHASPHTQPSLRPISIPMRLSSACRQNGNVAISRLPIPSAAPILIVDQTIVVLSLTYFQRWPVSANAATIDDILASPSLPRTDHGHLHAQPIRRPDGTTAIGAGGGTVSAPTELIAHSTGPLDKGTTFKLETFGPPPSLRNVPIRQRTFGSGLKIPLRMPVFHKEVKLAFPATDARRQFLLRLPSFARAPITPTPSRRSTTLCGRMGSQAK